MCIIYIYMYKDKGRRSYLDDELRRRRFRAHAKEAFASQVTASRSVYNRRSGSEESCDYSKGERASESVSDSASV